MKHKQIKQFETGITLLESLVAMLILSLGLLGTAHLMASSIKYSNGSYARTQATYYAETIAERMRANPDAINSGFNYDDINSDNISCATAPTTFCARNGATAGAICTTSELATYDAFAVSCGTGGTTAGNALKNDLPAGRLKVDCGDDPCTASSTYTIEVSWQETEDSNGSDVTGNKLVQYIIQP